MFWATFNCFSCVVLMEMEVGTGGTHTHTVERLPSHWGRSIRFVALKHKLL